jgi:predicted O-methyltransferase YrrM
MGGGAVQLTDADIAASAVHVYGAIQKTEELARFVDLVRTVEPQVVVEIGSYAGGTLWAWSQIAPRVYAVDLPPTGTYASTGTGQQTHGTGMVFGDSHDPLTVETLKGLLQGAPVDVLFIDGDHSYAGVKADHEMYAPLVRPGGLIAFHDIVAHPDQPGIEVSRYWEEIRTSDAIEFIDPTNPPWGGIGVLHAAGN